MFTVRYVKVSLSGRADVDQENQLLIVIITTGFINAHNRIGGCDQYTKTPVYKHSLFSGNGSSF